MVFSILVFYYFIIGAIEIFDVPISKKHIAFICVVPAFILTAFRDVSVGCDTTTYAFFYDRMIFSDSLFDVLSKDRMEFGYVAISYILSHMGLSFSQLQLILSAFIYTSFYFFLIRYSKNIGISCLVFLTMRYMLGTMNTVRMYLAIAVLWCSIPYIQKRNYLGFGLMVFLASAFHKTAFLSLFLYPLAMTKLSLKKVLLSLSIAGVFGYMGKSFFSFLAVAFGMYESYLNGQYLNFSGNIAVYLIFVIDVCFALFVLCNEKRENTFSIQSFKEYVSVEKICYAAVLFILCCDIVGFNFTLMSRLSDYYTFCWLILVPATFMRMKNKMFAIISLIIIALCLFAQFSTILALRPDWCCVEPYRFYFGEIF